MNKDNIFVDSDIILDVIFKRDPYFRDSQEILGLIENNLVKGYTSSLILANCYYILENKKNGIIAESTIRKLRSIITILPFTDKEIGESINSNFKDFEDGIQYFVCVNNKIKTLITRNVSHYKSASINILTPAEFLNLENLQKIIQNKKSKKE